MTTRPSVPTLWAPVQRTPPLSDPFDRLAAAAAALTEATDTTSTAGAIVEHVVGALGGISAMLAVVSPDGQSLELAGATGLPEASLSAWRHFPISSPAPLAEAVRSGEPRWPQLAAERAAQYPHLAAAYAASGAGAWLSLPLLTRGRAVGGLSIRFASPPALPDDERRLALALAALAATAIERARLHDSERRATETARFLAEASALLGESLDYEHTLAAVANAAVPRMADWCAVDLLDDHGEVRRLAVRHVDPSKVALAYDLQQRYPPRDGPGTVRHVLRSGQATLVEHVPDELLAAGARDEQHLTLLRSLGLAAYAIVPVRDGTRPVGALTVCMAESGRHLTPMDLAVLERLAERAALAIRHARLYQDAQQRGDDLTRLGTALRQTAEARDAALAEANAERQRLTALFNQVPAMIAVTRGSAHLVELANPAFLRTVGIRNVVGLPAREALPELAGQGIFERLSRAFSTGQPEKVDEVPARIDRNADGRFDPDEHGFFNFVYQPFRAAGGDVAGVMMHAVEVTEQVRARRALQAAVEERDSALSAAVAARDRLESVLNQLKDHYVAYDRQWRYVFVNDAAALVLGHSKHELLGACIWDLFPDAVGNDYYQAVHRAFEEQRDLVVEFHYAPFNRRFENHIYASPDGVAVLSTDVTHRSAPLPPQE